MNSNNELTRKDIEIGDEFEIDCEDTQAISFPIHAWFDVDKKFNINILKEDETWLNMYGKYNPYSDELKIECQIDRPEGISFFDYEPTESEKHLITDMLSEELQKRYQKTPKEFYDDEYEPNIEIGGIT